MFDHIAGPYNQMMGIAHRHRSLAALGPMAEAVLCAVTDRVMGDGA
jgi:hypothetical protein